MATPYERIRAAWQGPEHPWGIHRAAEAMAAEGVRRDDLDDALIQLLDEVRPEGADDDTQEIINSVSERVHGWCHRDYHIHFPEPGTTPTPVANGVPAATDRPVSPA